MDHPDKVLHIVGIGGNARLQRGDGKGIGAPRRQLQRFGKEVAPHTVGEDHRCPCRHTVGNDVAGAGDRRAQDHQGAEQENGTDAVAHDDILKNIAEKKRDQKLGKRPHRLDRDPHGDPCAQRGQIA